MEELLFLDRSAVLECAGEVDVCQVVTDALIRHARGASPCPTRATCRGPTTQEPTVVPWQCSGRWRVTARPLVRGIKLINAATSNPSLGRERAAGVSLLFDHHTARPVVIAEAGWLSAARTAAYTMVSLRHLGPPQWEELTLIGCGMLARSHLELLGASFPQARAVHLHDVDPGRATALADWVAQNQPGLQTLIHPDACAAVEAAPVVVTVTTTNEGYLPAAWLRPGMFVAHVSLADLLPDALLTAQALYVDDVDLVADNPRRILGALMHDGRVTARDSRPAEDAGSTERSGKSSPARSRRYVRPPDTSSATPLAWRSWDVALLHAIHEVAVRRIWPTPAPLLRSGKVVRLCAPSPVKSAVCSAPLLPSPSKGFSRSPS